MKADPLEFVLLIVVLCLVLWRALPLMVPSACERHCFHRAATQHAIEEHEDVTCCHCGMGGCRYLHQGTVGSSAHGDKL